MGKWNSINSVKPPPPSFNPPQNKRPRRPTNATRTSCPSWQPNSSATRLATEEAATRRGCVHPITPRDANLCGVVRCGAVRLVCVCVCVLGWGLSGMRRRLLLLVCGGTHFHTGTRTHPPHLGEVLRELRRLARARLPARHQHLGLQSFIGWKEKSVSQSYSIPINTRTQLRKTDRQTDRGQTDRQTERADRQTTE